MNAENETIGVFIDGRYLCKINEVLQNILLVNMREAGILFFCIEIFFVEM